MTDWQFLETKLIISVSLKAGRLTKHSKNAMYSDINDTKMPLNKDRLGSQRVASSPPLYLEVLDNSNMAVLCKMQHCITR